MNVLEAAAILRRLGRPQTAEEAEAAVWADHMDPDDPEV